VGDRGVDGWRGRGGEGIERETGHSGRRFVVSESIEEVGWHSEGVTHMGSIARLVVVTDRESDVLERGQRVAAVFGLEMGQSARYVGRIAAVTAVLSG
jgi:hypothetical protein